MNRIIKLFAIVSLLLAGFTLSNPQASADSIPIGSNAYYAVGPNILRDGIYSAGADTFSPISDGCLQGGGAMPFGGMCSMDGNTSSFDRLFGTTGLYYSNSANCGDTGHVNSPRNASFSMYSTLRGPINSTVDQLHFKFREFFQSDTGSGQQCLAISLLNSNFTGTPCDTCTNDKTLVYQSNLVGTSSISNATDVWLNITPQTVKGVYFRVGNRDIGASHVTGLDLFEVEAWNKNATNQSFWQSYADYLGSHAQWNTSKGTTGSYATVGVTLSPGAYVAVLPMWINATTGYASDMKPVPAVSVSYVTRGSTENVTTGGPNRACKFEAINMVVASTQNILFTPLAGTSVGTKVEPCYLQDGGFYAGQYFSSTGTNSTTEIRSDLSAWGLSSNALLGFLYSNASYPSKGGSDADMPQSIYCDHTLVTMQGCRDFELANTGLFSWGSMFTTANTLANTGAPGTTFTVNLADPFTGSPSYVGNALYLIVSQQTGRDANPYGIGTSAGSTPFRNAQISNGNTTLGAIADAYYPDPVSNDGSAYVHASVFYIDDIAKRNGLNNTDGNTGQANQRPYNSETYAFSVVSGFTTGIKINATTFLTEGSHYGMVCSGKTGICSSNLKASNTLPIIPANYINFHVVDTNQTPIAGARVYLSNNTTALFTNSNGDVSFPSWPRDAHFTLSADGYLSTCFNFYYAPTGASTQGTASDGCYYTRSFSTGVTVILQTQAQGAISSGGGASTIIVGAVNSLHITVKACGGQLLGNVCQSPGIGLQNAFVTVTNTAGTPFTAYTNALGVANVYLPQTNTSIGTVLVNAALDHYDPAGSYFSSVLSDDSFTLYMASQVCTITPSPGNWTIGQTVNFTVTQSTTGTLYYSIFQSTSTGLTTRVTTNPLYGTTSSYPLTYPSPSRPSALQDVGSYLLVVSDSSAVAKCSVPFTIYSGSGAAPTQITVNSGIYTTIGSVLSQGTVTAASSTNNNVAQDVATHNYVRDAVNFAYRTDILLPNMYLLALAALLVAVIVGGIRRNNQ